MILGAFIATPMLALVGTVYPAYATAKAITSKDTAAMTRWCQYWLIFAVLSLVSFAVDAVGSFLPFYWEARVAFALWLVADKFQGATFLCQKYVEPFLTSHQAAIDEQLDFVFARAKALKIEDVRALAEWAQKKAADPKLAGAAAVAKKAVAAATKAPEQADKPQEPEEVEVVEPATATTEDVKKDL